MSNKFYVGSIKFYWLLEDVYILLVKEHNFNSKNVFVVK